jgi:hypothetical protein
MSSKRGSCKRGREDDVIGDEEEENEDEEDEDEEPVENIVFVYQKTMADGTVETVQIPDLQVRGGGVCEYAPGMCKCTGMAVSRWKNDADTDVDAAASWQRWLEETGPWDEMESATFKPVSDTCTRTSSHEVMIPAKEVENQGLLGDILDTYLRLMPPSHKLLKGDVAIVKAYLRRTLTVLFCVVRYLKKYDIGFQKRCKWRFLLGQIPVLRLMLCNVQNALSEMSVSRTPKELDDWHKKVYSAGSTRPRGYDVIPLDGGGDGDVGSLAKMFVWVPGGAAVDVTEWLMALAEIMTYVNNLGKDNAPPESAGTLCMAMDACRVVTCMLGGPVYLARFSIQAAMLMHQISWAAEPVLFQVYARHAGFKLVKGWKLPQDDPLYDECVKVVTDLFLPAYHITARWRLPSDTSAAEDLGMDSVSRSVRADALRNLAICMALLQEFVEPLLAPTEDGPRGAAQAILKVVAMTKASFNYTKCAFV